MPTFSQRHYVAIAKVLKSTIPDAGAYYDRANPAEVASDTWENVCLAFLNQFKNDNPKFDREKFLAACKGER